MKEAGVDFIATCIDLNGMKTLAQELERQGMDDVVLYHPNTYNQSFVAEAGDLFEGDFVSVAVPARSRPTAEGTALADFLEWMDEAGQRAHRAGDGRAGSTPPSPSTACWPPGPSSTAAKVIAATNAMTDFTAGGLIEPIDWTVAHTPYTEATRDVDTSAGVRRARCGSRTASSSPMAPEGPPWLCWDGADTRVVRARADLLRLTRRDPLPHDARRRRSADDVLRALLQGTPPGTVYALIALGFVLTYKTSGVFNLAFGAQAYVSAALFFHARDGVGVGDRCRRSSCRCSCWRPRIGLVLERLIFRHLRTGSAVAKLVVTIGLSVALPNLFDLIVGFQAVAGSHPARASSPTAPPSSTTRSACTPSAATSWWRSAWPWSAMVGLAALFRFTAIGLRMRAVVESPRMTELNGIRADRVSAFSWALSSFFAGHGRRAHRPAVQHPGGARLLQPRRGRHRRRGRRPAREPARGRSSAGLGLGMLIAFVDTFLPRWVDDHAWLRPIQDNLTPAMPFVVLFGVLVLWPAIRRTREVGDPLSGVDPPPPSLAAADRERRRSRAPPGSSPSSSSRCVGLVVLVTGRRVVAVPRHPGGDPLHHLPVDHGDHRLRRPDLAVPGHLRRDRRLHRLPARRSLRHVGAPRGRSSARSSPPASGRSLSLPVLRLGGVWVAIATLAFAFFFDAVMVKFSWVGGGGTSLLQGTRVPRPIDRPVGPRRRPGVPRARARRLRRRVARRDPDPGGHGRPHPARAARQRGGRRVDRHLAGAGPGHRLRGRPRSSPASAGRC